MAPPGTTRVSLVLAAAVAAVSLAAIFIRLAAAPGIVVAVGRMVFASVLMAPLTLRGLARTPIRGRSRAFTLAAGVLLGVHFGAWITSLSFTSVAASVTLVNTVPLWVALFAWLFTGKSPSFSVLIGVVMAVGGAAIIGFGGLGGGTAPLVGDGLALLGAAAVAGYLLLGRQVQHSGVGLDAYAGAAYALAALFLAPFPAVFGFSYVGYGGMTFVWILLLALVPQLIGHNGINYAVRHLDPTLVSTVILLEPVGSTLLAFIILGEVPTALTLIGAAVLLAGVVFTVRSTEPSVPGTVPPEVLGD
ncbi:MAG: DMT family transporter [Deinococcales bacterium]